MCYGSTLSCVTSILDRAYAQVDEALYIWRILQSCLPDESQQDADNPRYDKYVHR